MLHIDQRPASLDVLVATPAGTGGQGGVDRIMTSLRDELDRQQRGDLNVVFAASRGAGHIAASPFYLMGFCLRMVAARLAGRLDLVHINISSSGSTYRKLVIAGVARQLGVPYVLHLHGADYREFWGGARPALEHQIRKLFEGAARIVVLGAVWRDFVAARAPAAADNIVIVPNASSRPVLPHRGGGNTVHILFLGRIGDRKGVPQLSDALKRMEGLGNWRATIAGDGDVDALRARTAELGLSDRVSLPGWVDGKRVAELIAEADILVLPSFSENLPVSIIEGMAAGLAVVATPVGAVEEIVKDGETGLLVQPGDVEGLAEAMTRLVEDPALRARLGVAAQQFHRERLDLEPFANAIRGVWQAATR